LAGTDPQVRTVAVTGASAGIGAAAAIAFGALGWQVALGARRAQRRDAVAREVEAVGGTALSLDLDVTDESSIDRFFDAIESRFGTADALVNNAGIGIPAMMHEAKTEDLRRELEVNLLGPMLVSRRALRSMRALGRGDIVFVTSLNAVAPRPLQTGYTASHTSTWLASGSATWCAAAR
jgi:NAD(P)-dependent dehydrogenase (short-subunit alcohol dehydrogenase family)